MSQRCPSCGTLYDDALRACPVDGASLVPASNLTPVRAELPDLTGLVLDGRYQVGDKVGEGGMAFVYRALDRETGDPVAIKILLPALVNDPTAMSRLRLEAELGARLAHPNLCHIVRLGETGAGFDYIVMPFLEGEMLCERTWRSGQLPLETAVWIVRDICAGLDVAHDQGVVHRDLKPENIMLVKGADGTERAVVLDFGLAIGLGMTNSRPRLTKTGLVVGTPDFMSPEQMRGKPVDRRSDTYSVAFITYEMLTGELPFGGTTLREMAMARMKGESIPIREKRPDLDFPPSLEKVLLRALAADPDDRYQTATAFALAFEHAATGKAGGLLGWIGRVGR